MQPRVAEQRPSKAEQWPHSYGRMTAIGAI